MSPSAFPDPHRRFAAAMAAFAPFEPRPHLAVAVSGGADSLALVVLADTWARSRRGRVTALTVDHRLRAAAAGEARRVAAFCAARGIAHQVLRWNAGKTAPRRGIQARARAARYALLEGWCAAHGALHLLTAHQRDDQAETFLLRLGQGSGLMGLAAMTPLRELDWVRLLRPLLGFSRDQLEAFLRDAGHDWLRDPSNRDPAYARVRLRALMPELAGEALDAADMGAVSARIGAVRAGLDDRLAERLALAVRPHPAGFMRIDRKCLTDGAAWEGERALARVLGAVGGGTYPPRGERLRRLYLDIVKGDAPGCTLAGCRILPEGSKTLLVCREAAAMAPPTPLKPGVNRWDGRFVLKLAPPRDGARARGAGRLSLGALGRAGLVELRRAAPECLETVAARAIPAPVRPTLAAFYDAGGLLAVPHLGYRRSGKGTARLLPTALRPFVSEPLAGPRFFPVARGL